MTNPRGRKRKFGNKEKVRGNVGNLNAVRLPCIRAAVFRGGGEVKDPFSSEGSCWFNTQLLPLAYIRCYM